MACITARKVKLTVNLHSDAKDGSYSMRPLLYFHEGKLLFQYTRRIFAGYGAFQRFEDIPALTEAQAEVMDAIEFLSREHSVSLDLKKGDIQFVNSVSILHFRDAFQDTPTHKYVLHPAVS